MVNDKAQPPGSAERQGVVELLFGSMKAHTLRAAIRLRIFETVGEAERSADDIAAEAGTQPQATLRLLRALASLGLLTEGAPGAFSATAQGTLLRSDVPGSLASLIAMLGEPTMQRAWEHLDDSVRSGDTSFGAVFGKDFFAHLREHPELSALFNAAMSQATKSTAAALPHSYDFSRFTTVADVGGGDGTLLAAVLGAHPALSGIVYDSQEGLAQAPATLEREGLTDRCSLVAGDFFRSAPDGADLYLLKSIVHDWTDEQAATILSHCRDVLPPEGRVLIVEPVLPPVVGPEADAGTYLSDLNMLVNVGGRERTRADFEAVCRRAGLAVTSISSLPAPNTFCLIEARAA
ncbi:methyltransferase [Streptomyces sp. NPDC051907]|uniref:methyltransferase n=1 Tax=Streptomyces sp. NPDC051907 TaxID=3155284 RepID=UPI00342A29E1